MHEENIAQGNRSNASLHHRPEVVLHGTSICPGIVIGRIHVIDANITIPQSRVDAGQVTSEQERYTQAINAAKQHLRNHVASMHSNSLLEAQTIFETHQAILSDESIHNRVRNCIKQQGMCAEFCLDQEAQTIITQFNSTRDLYLKDRGEDIRDLAQNLLAFLSGVPQGDLQHPIQATDILVSRHLHPSEVFRIHQAKGLGFACESRALSSRGHPTKGLWNSIHWKDRDLAGKSGRRDSGDFGWGSRNTYC
jgi:phosphotransferase system enzyme I (PtsI)